jgi:hypothetical protein
MLLCDCGRGERAKGEGHPPGRGVRNHGLEESESVPAGWLITGSVAVSAQPDERCIGANDVSIPLIYRRRDT